MNLTCILLLTFGGQPPDIASLNHIDLNIKIVSAFFCLSRKQIMLTVIEYILIQQRLLSLEKI